MSKCKLKVFSDIHYLDISVDEKEIHKKRKLTQYAEILTDRLIRKINEEEPDGVYFEVELENRNIQIAERHIKL